jgi:eukaryotic-like serine/threonine-protein kinase
MRRATIHMSQLPTNDFVASSRFEIRRQIGIGGMGVVYEALDRERNELVALKTIRQINPESVYRLKREFRTTPRVIF